MKMYDFNQSLYSSLPNIFDTEKEEAKKIIIDYLDHNPSKYYMMLNNESHYYTVYTFPHGFYFDKMTEEIMSIAEELGEIKAIHPAPDNQAIEFWIKTDDECRVYYLFNYENGVIEID